MDESVSAVQCRVWSQQPYRIFLDDKLAFEVEMDRETYLPVRSKKRKYDQSTNTVPTKAMDITPAETTHISSSSSPSSNKNIAIREELMRLKEKVREFEAERQRLKFQESLSAFRIAIRSGNSDYVKSSRTCILTK
eukprot:TRINITY_DN15110_c0_g1_i1.p1 TRINITY_DN15110_c0_g1~~TRINITY_DN15110_c0_g1_i1.p1  ORF type:complete len:157 (+),score=28.52 TRINITY_DN15110_c0_g1_i1:64-471(+)